jgi:hypothetical protein
MRLAALAMLMLAALLFSACGPTVTVSNRTPFVVRASVNAGGSSQMLSPSPNESSSAEVDQGPYRVTVVPDKDWVEYAKATRAYLNERIANSDNLTGPQLLETIQRLKDIASAMQKFEKAAGPASGCGGTVSNDASASVTVSLSDKGELVAACR